MSYYCHVIKMPMTNNINKIHMKFSLRLTLVDSERQVAH